MHNCVLCIYFAVVERATGGIPVLVLLSSEIKKITQTAYVFIKRQVKMI